MTYRAGFPQKALEGPQARCTPHQRSGSKSSCAHSGAMSEDGQWPDLLVETGHVGVGWAEPTLTSQAEPEREGA